MDRDGGTGGRGRMNIVGVIIAVIIGILLIGVVLKILKVAIIVALCVGIVMFVQNKLGSNRNDKRIR
jgi:4-hydroxybenzoate polyprenyltransferase